MKLGDTYEHCFKVDKKVYQGFIDIFNDKNPMHTDLSFATKMGYNNFIMHGNILGGFLSYFIGQLLPIENVIIISQKIGYNKPFFLGDDILLKAEVKNISDSVGIVDFKYKFFRETDLLVAKGIIQIKVLG